MPDPGLSRDQARTAAIRHGRQDKITGGGASNGSQFDQADTLESLAALAASGTYRFRIPTMGSRKVTVTIRPTTTGTAATARIYSTLSDGITENTAKAATVLTCTNNTMTEASRTLDGEQFVVVEFITVAASTIDFTYADYRCEPA